MLKNTADKLGPFNGILSCCFLAIYLLTGCHSNTITATRPKSSNDLTDPKPGKFLPSTSVTQVSFTLNWTEASDTSSSGGDLQYRVCSGASLAEIDSVEKCEGATVEMPYAAGTLTYSLSKKAAATTYFYNVVVKNKVGKKTVYPGIAQATSGTSEETVTDKTAPTAGTFSTSTSVGVSSLTLNWSSGSDTVTAATSLSYFVCSGASSTAIDTVSECEAATMRMNWATSVLSNTISGLAVGTTYYFNVIVRDEAGNKAIYPGKTETTVADIAPVANSQSFAVSYETETNTVLTATDADSDPLTYIIVSGPAHGTLTGAGANKKYTPNTGFSGADSFTFKANDGLLDSAVATITLTVSSAITIYLRTTGSDLGSLNPADQSTPALTAQRAFDFAISKSPSVAHPVIIDVGFKAAGNFGNIMFNDSTVENISWTGVNSTNSKIGSITGYGSNGASGYVGVDGNGDPMSYPRVGGNSGPGITITANSTVSFGSISSIGGVAGSPIFSPDVASTGAGGSIVTSVGSIVGDIESRAGATSNSDDTASPGGSITVGGTAGAISSIGSCGIDSTNQGCPGGGAITITGQVGNITSAAATITVEAGASAGSISATGSVPAGMFGGTLGGTVVVNGTVGSVDVTGSDAGSTGGGSGGTGGQITINSGATSGNLTARGGAGVDNGSGGVGGTITYSLTSTTGTKNVSGGAPSGTGASGSDGTISTIP